jgi:predicted RNase H-like HicB family nuclease
MKYLVVIEQGPNCWGAHVPDLPGCVAAGDTRDEVLELISEAIRMHVDSLKENGDPVPSPSSEAQLVEVSAA